MISKSLEKVLRKVYKNIEPFEDGIKAVDGEGNKVFLNDFKFFNIEGVDGDYLVIKKITAHHSKVNLKGKDVMVSFDLYNEDEDTGRMSFMGPAFMYIGKNGKFYDGIESLAGVIEK